MHQVIPRLHVSAPHDLGFGIVPLQARSWLLQRDDGNVLIYGAAAVDSDAARAELAALGGVERQYLNHSHEASPASDRLGAPLLVHESDAAEVARTATVAHTFSRRHRVGDDLEVIPAPGHTPGATAYLWDAGGRRVLFTGDTIFVRHGEWVAALLDGISDREAYLESLALLRGLDFDLLAPGVTPIEQPAWHDVAPGEAARRIDAIIERVRAGADG
ncbi:MAG TPA: MBL fold metallo-hydrolase [Capillimicrobium sp.]